MRLYVYVLEARDLQPRDRDPDGLIDTYAKLQLGTNKSKTKVVKKSLCPVWNEEFVFRADDMDDELIVSVADDRDNGRSMGRVQIPLRSVFEEEKQTLVPTWFSLQPTAGKSKNQDSGKILLTISLSGRSSDNCVIRPSCAHQKFSNSTNPELPDSDEASGDIQSPTTHSDHAKINYGSSSSFSFEEAIESMQSQEYEMPENLPGGILLDKTYIIASKDLNKILFAPDSQFRKDLAKMQGTTDLEEGPWTLKSGKKSYLRRLVTYTKAAKKLVKGVKAIEEQMYCKAHGKEFAVLVSVSTPDVPYGNCFKVELLYKMMPGPELSTGEESSRLVVSWNVNFYQSTVMKGMIEAGARLGLKENFEQFGDLLAQNLKPVESAELLLDKKRMLEPLQMEPQGDWELAIEYLWDFTVVSTVFMVLYVLLHIILSGPSKLQGLEFNGFDLPDTFGELIACGVLVLQVERVFYMVSHFVQARVQRGSDHGVKGQGDGWLLTVALIEGNDLAPVELTGLSDPYAVFTCNGKTRTSSVKLQTCNPEWNEILEFDAMEEPPSVLDVEIFDFDGPFDQDISLGHAEINFLKHTSAELADIWVPLDGKLAQAFQTKLHLRIFLDNSKGDKAIREYLTKMEKEVGKKLNQRSPHRNLTFQKIFALPPEEFLINDFSCYLKRKLPLQGRLFLSARIVGFYANLFGHKTKFFILWEDIEDVQLVPPSLVSFGSPSLIVILRKGRGLDARHGAKVQDEEGRLRFHFQSFVSFNVASRTIMALWKTRTLCSDHKAQIAEDQQDLDGRSGQIEDTGSFLGIQDANMSKFYSSELPVNMNLLMEMFGGGDLDRKIMAKSGCLNYTMTPWEAVRPNAYERHIHYKFNRHVSIFGGEVTSTQKKAPIADGNGWIVEDVMTLHDVPFGDHFRVHLKYQIETLVSVTKACKCEAYIGIAWLKSTKFMDKITKNISEKLACRIKEIFELALREILLARR